MNRLISLGDLVEFQRGYDLPIAKTHLGQYKVIGSSGAMAYHNQMKSGPSVVIGRSGTIGNPQLVLEDFWPHNTALFIKDFKGNSIRYIYYLLKNLDIEKMKTGSNIPTLNRNHLHPLLVYATADIDKQKKIAQILFDIDSKIENNNKINAELEAMAKTVYDYWFLQFEFPNEEGKPYKSSGGKMVWNEELKREIPEGWSNGNLYNIAEYINGLACQKFRPKDGEVTLPVVKIKEMHEGVTDATEVVSINIPDRNKIRRGDVLFSWSATIEVMYWVGDDAGLNQHIFKVCPKNFYSKEYVYHQLTSYTINFVKIAEARKTTMGHITADHLSQSKIVLPPESVIEEFDVITSSLRSKIITYAQENQELASLRDFLLPLLMNGQVGFKEV